MAEVKNKKPSESVLPNKTAPPQEVIIQLPLTELHPFPNHPFQVRDDDSMKKTAESIKQFGVLVPAIGRSVPDGGYEIISGHRRKHASKLAGLDTMPCIVRDMDTPTLQNHTFTYGSWQSYNGTQHRRLRTCSACGYSDYEYANHSLSYGSWTSANATQHKRSCLAKSSKE